MWIHYIKAGLVNLVGASCKRHGELKLCGTIKIILPCSVSSVWLLRHMQELTVSLFIQFPGNKSVCLVSFRSPPWINPPFKCVHCMSERVKLLGSVSWTLESYMEGGYQMWLIVTHDKTMCAAKKCNQAPKFIQMHQSWSLTPTHKAQSHIHHQSQTAIKSLLLTVKRSVNVMAIFLFFARSRKGGEHQDS